jgi:hypothetical protein
VFHLTCCLLPKVHRDVMEVLFNFMNWVASFHTVDEETGSKMDVHNLATVIAPNILYSDLKSPDMDSSFLGIEAVATMIECNEMFSEECLIHLCQFVRQLTSYIATGRYNVVTQRPDIREGG